MECRSPELNNDESRFNCKIVPLSTIMEQRSQSKEECHYSTLLSTSEKCSSTSTQSSYESRTNRNFSDDKQRELHYYTNASSLERSLPITTQSNLNNQNSSESRTADFRCINGDEPSVSSPESIPSPSSQYGERSRAPKFIIDPDAPPKKYECPHCSYSSNIQCHISNHIRIHSGEKPFKCQTCEKTFTQKSSLKLHSVIHTGEKPYGCPVCYFHCNNKGNLRKHMTKHTGERPFHCNMCDKAFAQKSSLNLHQIIHTGIKPYGCNVCDFHCNVRGNLKKHMMKHTGEKPFSCEVCLKAFSQKTSLKNHMSVHSCKSGEINLLGDKNHVADVVCAVSKLPTSSSEQSDASSGTEASYAYSSTPLSSHSIFSTASSNPSNHDLHGVYTANGALNASHEHPSHAHRNIYSTPVKNEISINPYMFTPGDHIKYQNNSWR